MSGAWAFPSERLEAVSISRDKAQAIYPTSWEVYLNKGNNRARLVDADGRTIQAGMNVAKAHIIAAAVNRDAVKPDGEPT